MQTEDTKEKTKPLLVFLIIFVVILVASYTFSAILKSQSEEKIALQKQNDENLKEYIISGTNQKVTIPSASATESEELIPSSANTTNPSGQTQQKQETQQTTSVTQETRNPPSMELDKNKKYKAIMDTTEGQIEVELFADKTPITVNNFVYLSKKFFYDGTVFHRVIDGFMIQGGDPTGTGAGGPGYKFDDEPFDGEYTRGTLAMANAGPNTNGSQFFIVHEDSPLPKNYVIFGKVTKGMDVVDKIATGPVTISPSGEKSKPVNPIKIRTIDIVESPIE